MPSDINDNGLDRLERYSAQIVNADAKLKDCLAECREAGISEDKLAMAIHRGEASAESALGWR